MLTLLLAFSLVAKSIAHTLCHNHPGYVTRLNQATARSDNLREDQSRIYCFEATRDFMRPSVASLYIKFATCSGTLSVRVFDPAGNEIVMNGRDCGIARHNTDNHIRYDPSTWAKAGVGKFSVSTEHSILTYHNNSAMLGVYTIIVTAEKTHDRCGAAEYEILASTMRYRQPPILPKDTCIMALSKFTTSTTVGLSWLPAQVPAGHTHIQTIKYCVYLMPVTDLHSHKCSDHGSRCSMARLRDENTKEMCFESSRRTTPIWTIMRGLKPNTEYHVDVIAWTFANDIYYLPMAYSQSQYITTLPG